MEQHDIITSNGIDMLVKKIHPDGPLYSITSESERFQEIFGTNELRARGKGEELQYWIEDHVEVENQTEAVGILDVILKALQ